MTPTRTCLHCGDPLIGRSDKKFCDDQCRSNYNNRVNSDVTAHMRNINHILRTNRRILVQVLGARATSQVTRARLLEKGFHFKYHTHTYTTRDGHAYAFFYEYGILPMENDRIMVVKWKKEWEH